jgi:hypothetical protein
MIRDLAVIKEITKEAMSHKAPVNRLK